MDQAETLADTAFVEALSERVIAFLWFTPLGLVPVVASAQSFPQRNALSNVAACRVFDFGCLEPLFIVNLRYQLILPDMNM
jgi:hypothetical protein